MKLGKIFLVVFLCGFEVQGKLFVSKNTKNEDVSLLVTKLAVEMNSKDSSTRDVVILKFPVTATARHDVDDIVHSIVESLPRENIVTIPELNQVTNNERTRNAALIIIVSDASNGVSPCYHKC